MSLERTRLPKFQLVCPIEQKAGRWYLSMRIGTAEDREASFEALTVHKVDVVEDVPTAIDGASFDVVIRTRETEPRFYGVVLPPKARMA